MNGMIQLIRGDRSFNVSGLYNFSKRMNLGKYGASYTVVSIIGAQSSGKSTLLNLLFGTNFKTMDAEYGRSQTTEGAWLAKAVDIECCTLVIDVEGSDGTERGEDDALFESQTALFSFAVSDIIIINLSSLDVGRVRGGSLNLLGIIFKKTISLENQRKRTLLFVLRDKSKTSLENLTEDLWRSIEKIYDSVPKAEDQKANSLNIYFNIQIISLPHYELQEQEFMDQVASLRERFTNSTTNGGLKGDQPDKAPASEFPIITQSIWKSILDDKDLVIPTNKIMIASVRCDKLINELEASFETNKDRHQLVEVLKTGRVEGFGKKMNTIIETYLSQYDVAAFNFDEGIKTSKRQILLEKMLKLVQPAYESLLEDLYSKSLKNFEATFENALCTEKFFSVVVEECKGYSLSVFGEECKEAEIPLAGWDSSKLLSRFEGDIGSYVTYVDARLAVARAVESLEVAEAEAAAAKEIATRADAEAKNSESELAAALATASKIAAETKEAFEAQIAIAQAETALGIARSKAIQAEQVFLVARLSAVEAAADKTKKEDILSRALKVITNGVTIAGELVQVFKGMFFN